MCNYFHREIRYVQNSCSLVKSGKVPTVIVAEDAMFNFDMFLFSVCKLQ